MAGRLKRQQLSNPGKPQKAHRSRSDNGIVSASADARWEWVGIVFLALAVVWTLVTSWRKWPDPVVDFGRELYLPWRLSEGAVLYRDVDHLYGPLSQYFNALIFYIFGAGMMKIVRVNLLIYCASLALIYHEVRAGWGRLAAFTGSLLFILLFSFCQFLLIGNYNFVTPYAHETTHGFLLVLVLILIWASWLRDPRPWKTLTAGICCGLSVLLKAEIIITAAAVTLCALMRAALLRPDFRSLKTVLRSGSFFLAGGLLPVLIAIIAFWRTSSFGTALSWSNNAWLSLFSFAHIAEEPTQREFLGTSNLWENLRAMLVLGPLSVAMVFGVGLLCKRIVRGKVAVAVSVALVLAAALASLMLPWLELGKVFPAWLCLAALAEFWRTPPAAARSPSDIASTDMRWLLLIAAAAFLARMALNPRFFHYGYYQAALAGAVTMAAIFRSMPDLLNIRKSGRATYIIVMAICLASGIWQLEEIPLQYFNLKTTPIAEGADLFYGFDSRVEPTASLVEEARQTLIARPECKTLVVLPEGVMLNYLLRKPSTIPEFMFVPSLIRGAMGTRLLEGLKTRPPDCVVLISRDMQEFGVSRFGDAPEHGSEVLSWLDENYKSFRQIGGDPLDVNQRGVTLYERQKPSDNAP
jgi:hypothetical protein